MIALVRGVAASFAQAITMETLAAPIMLDLAQQQHKQYVDLLKGLLDEVLELPADDKFPGQQQQQLSSTGSKRGLLDISGHCRLQTWLIVQ